jgi:hypothetical protein
MANESVWNTGHEIRFATVDPGTDAKEIRSELLQVLRALFMIPASLSAKAVYVR